MNFYNYLKEMAKPTYNIITKTYYHGTASEEAGKSIINNGIKYMEKNNPFEFDMDSRQGKVYITPYLPHAVTFTLGDELIGEEFDDVLVRVEGRYGYLFTVTGHKLLDVDPDEDSIGIAIYKNNGPKWLMDLANKIIPTDQREIINRTGSIDIIAKWGKVIVDELTDEQKIELITNGSHIAHEGILMPDTAWKFDKKLSVKLKSDCSNFFDLAERIKGF